MPPTPLRQYQTRPTAPPLAPEMSPDEPPTAQLAPDTSDRLLPRRRQDSRALHPVKRRERFVQVARANPYCLRAANYDRAPAPFASSPAPKTRSARDQARETPTQSHQSPRISYGSAKSSCPQSWDPQRTDSATIHRSPPLPHWLPAQCNLLP